MQHAAQPGASGGEAALFVLLVLIPIALLAAYLAAAACERGQWPAWRTASFTAGIGLLLAAMSSPVLDWAHTNLRGHMIQHLLLGMYAPLALALGAPVTLLLRRLPTRAGRGVVSLLNKRPVRILIHPLTAAVLDIGGMYVLYLTPLYALSVSDPLTHVLLHVHFVVSGYLFAWAIAGPDPAPRRPRFRTRLVALFLATAAHSMLAKIMYGHGFPRGTSAGIGETEAAARLMYYGGDIAELLLMVAFFAWFRGPRLLALSDRQILVPVSQRINRS